MKTIIRIQDKLGRGMFQSGNPLADIEGTPSVYDIPALRVLADRHSSFPTAMQDEKISAFLKSIYINLSKSYYDGTCEYRFAFKNLTQFEDWVKRKEVKTLQDYGYKVYKIMATDVVESRYQSIFHIDSVVSMEDITNLFLD